MTTVDEMLRDPGHVARTLDAMRRDGEVSAGLFPTPRARDPLASCGGCGANPLEPCDPVYCPRQRPQHRRGGRGRWSWRRRRAEHRARFGRTHTVGELLAELALRPRPPRLWQRPPVPVEPTYLGERYHRIRFFGIAPDENDPAAAVGTLTLMPSAGAVTIDALYGSPDAPDTDEFPTGPVAVEV